MYAIYLRKSRLDTDYAGDTLKRHEKTLTEFCKNRRLPVGKIYREVVSGETLSARVQMQALLNDITQGQYDGVVCMDIDRLSRGSSLDSGYIMQVLQAYNCKIITPTKTYDLTTDTDEQFTDMQFMLSRFELKTITKRLSRGRATSAREGKFVGSIAPYGYKRVKIQGDKGYTLEPVPDEIPTVRKIFDMYINGMGYSAIAEYLKLIDSSKRWSKTSVMHVITNPVYCGRIRWGATPVKREIIDGQITKKRGHNLMNCDEFVGLHEPIIDNKTYERALAVRNSHTSVNLNREITNPFANLMRCGKCGGSIHMNKCSKKNNTRPWYYCTSKQCDCRSTKYDIIENAVLNKMREWFKDYQIEIKQPAPSSDVENLERRLSELKKQQIKLCELLETGIYDVDLFTERNNVLRDNIKTCQIALKNAQGKAKGLTDDITPYCDELLAFYDVLSVPAKNTLWHKVLDHVEYYRQSGSDDIFIEIFPRVR